MGAEGRRVIAVLLLKMCLRMARKICNLGHNTLELCNVLVQIPLNASKTKRDIQYSKLGIQVASSVAKRLKNYDPRK